MATWTAGTDRSDGYVVGATLWNQMVGATGSMMFLYDNYHRFKYKTATQSFAATTTYADVTATSGNLAFSVAANTTYRIIWQFTLTAVGTAGSGGLKIQLTGPAAPTAVQIYGTYPYVGTGGTDRGAQTGSATAFSSDIFAVAAVNSGSTAGISTHSIVTIDALIVNGANAGTVTLQGAQNAASGTTTIGTARAFAHQLGTQ